MSHVLQLGGNIVLAMVLLLLIAVLISVYSMSTNIRHSLQESGIRNIDTLCEIRFLDELDSELQSDPAMDIIKSVDGNLCVANRIYKYRSGIGEIEKYSDRP